MKDDIYKAQAKAFVTKTLKELDARARSRGVTLNNAVKRAGIDTVTVWRWKSGDQEPGIFRLALLAKAIEDYKPEKGKKT